MEMKHVKPEPGFVIRTRDGRTLPPEGALVPWDRYWRQRVADKGLVVVDEPAPTKDSSDEKPTRSSKASSSKSKAQETDK